MILNVNGQTRTRCDGCGKYARGQDVFDKFYVSTPAGLHPITGEAQEMPLYETGQNVPRNYHVCPVCAVKIRRAHKEQRPEIFPDGPLRKDILAAMQRRSGARGAHGSFLIHYCKDSRLGQVA